jgi:hypothetical protein
MGRMLFLVARPGTQVMTGVRNRRPEQFGGRAEVDRGRGGAGVQVELPGQGPKRRVQERGLLR